MVPPPLLAYRGGLTGFRDAGAGRRRVWQNRCPHKGSQASRTIPKLQPAQPREISADAPVLACKRLSESFFYGSSTFPNRYSASRTTTTPAAERAIIIVG